MTSVSNVSIKTVKEIDGIRRACVAAAESLLGVGEMIAPGVTTEDINRFVHEDTLRRGGIPATLNYHGFPKSVCTSVNEVVCHGIPGPRVLQPGDIINVDVTTILDGFHGDTSATFYIGTPSPEAKHVTEVSRHSLELGMAQVREGARLGDIGAAIQEFAEREGCSVVRAFVGHGIGRKFHEAPQVPHTGTRGKLDRLRAGMCFTIEPMINLGGYEVEIHTLVVTKSGHEVLTRRSRRLSNSEIFSDLFAICAV
jgi:methionyl aminopeptidase